MRSEQLAFAVIQVLRDHRAVQVEVDRVERGRLHRVDDLARDALVGVGGHMRRGASTGPDDGRDGMPHAHARS
jgi:hypothetical protein